MDETKELVLSLLKTAQIIANKAGLTSAANLIEMVSSNDALVDFIVGFLDPLFRPGAVSAKDVNKTFSVASVSEEDKALVEAQGFDLAKAIAIAKMLWGIWNMINTKAADLEAACE